MNQPTSAILTTLRIPGNWSGPQELLSRLPDGVRITPEHLILSDETRLEFEPMPPDNQFASIFRTSCRYDALPSELDVVDHYTVNVCLSGPGGSLDAARKMMQAGAAIVRAGAGGVFIDNSGLAHGGSQWVELTEDGSPDALSFAFVGIVRGKEDVWTVGMHILGLPDLVLPHSEAEADAAVIIETIRYMCGCETRVADGHILADENGPRFQVRSAKNDKFDLASPMHNPFGRLRMVSVRAIAESN